MRRQRAQRVEDAQQGVTEAAFVARDQLRVVEVVARVAAHPAREAAADVDLAGRVQEGDLDAVDLVRVFGDDLEEGVRGLVEIGAPPVTLQGRVEHRAQPVQDHRFRRLAQEMGVRGEVVLGPPRRADQGARGHEDRLDAVLLGQGELLLVRRADVRERDLARRRQLVGAHAAGDPATHRLRLGGRAADQFGSPRPVKPHPALRGVHGLRDAQAVRPQVAAEGERGLPVDGRRVVRGDVRVRVRDHVRRREDRTGGGGSGARRQVERGGAGRVGALGEVDRGRHAGCSPSLRRAVGCGSRSPPLRRAVGRYVTASAPGCRSGGPRRTTSAPARPVARPGRRPAGPRCTARPGRHGAGTAPTAP